MTTVLNAPSVVAVLRGLAQTIPGHDAVVFVRDPERPDGTARLTYAQLDREARRLAVRLRADLEPGDRVLLLYPNGIDFPIAFFGCLYAGMIPVAAPMPGRERNGRRVKLIARDADVRVVLTDAESMPEVADWVAAEGLAGVTAIATDGGEVAKADPASWVEPATSLDAPAFLQYTSGSTSEPKGVVVTQANLLHNLHSLGELFELPPGSRFGGWIPLYHDMGLVANLLCGVLLGKSCVLMTPTTFLRRPHLWLQVIDEYNIGYSAAPNFAYELCCRRVTPEQMARLDLSRWWIACNGSEPVHAETLRTFAETFAPAGLRPDAIAPCFGMAEATVLVSGSVGRPPVMVEVDAELFERNVVAPPVSATAKRRELVSCGTPCNIDVRIIDPHTGQVLPEGRIGEIWLRGGSVVREYWRNEAATRATFDARISAGEPGFLRTGDLGLLRDGELYITGRIKETLVINGRNLYPQDIEHELRARHAELSSTVGAAFTVSDDALVVTHEIRGSFSPEQLGDLANEMKLTVAKEFGLAVERVALLRPGSVRRTTSGKIQRAEMRELFLAGGLQPIYASSPVPRS